MRKLTTVFFVLAALGLTAQVGAADWPAAKSSLPGVAPAGVEGPLAPALSDGQSRPTWQNRAVPQADSVDAHVPGTQRERVEAEQADLAWTASRTKGVARLQVLEEQNRLDGLIRDLESGRSVDPASITSGGRSTN